MISNKLHNMLFKIFCSAGLVTCLMGLPLSTAGASSNKDVFTQAQTVSIFFSRSQATLPPNTAFSLMIDAGSYQIVFAQIHLTFDPAKIRLTSEIQTTSLLSTVVEKTSMAAANSTGYIKIVLALPPGKPAPSSVFQFAQLPFGAVSTVSNQSTNILVVDQKVQIVDMNATQLPNMSESTAITLNPVPPPPAAMLVSPTGSIDTNNPTYTWSAVSGATWYYLWVSRVNTDGSLTTVQNNWYQASAACGSSTCSARPDLTLSRGNYRWWVQTWNGSGGYGPWSTGMSFTATAPAAATLLSPSGAITETKPAYIWNAVSGATWYNLWVNRPAGGPINIWYTAAQAGCAGGAGSCSVTPDVTLSAGGHTWWIQTWNPVGYGPWSSRMDFTVSP